MEEEEDEEEEPEMPDEWKNLTYKQQQTRIFIKSFLMMISGLAIVLIFTDPMIACLNKIG